MPMDEYNHRNLKFSSNNLLVQSMVLRHWKFTFVMRDVATELEILKSRALLHEHTIADLTTNTYQVKFHKDQRQFTRVKFCITGRLEVFIAFSIVFGDGYMVCNKKKMVSINSFSAVEIRRCSLSLVRNCHDKWILTSLNSSFSVFLFARCDVLTFTECHQVIHLLTGRSEKVN